MLNTNGNWTMTRKLFWIGTVGLCVAIALPMYQKYSLHKEMANKKFNEYRKELVTTRDQRIEQQCGKESAYHTESTVSNKTACEFKVISNDWQLLKQRAIELNHD